jgi:hypothetical protein
MIDPLGQNFAVQPVEVSLVAKVFRRGQVAVQTLVLKDDADSAANGQRVACDVDVKDLCASLLWLEKGGEDAKKGCLPAAVRPQ